MKKNLYIIAKNKPLGRTKELTIKKLSSLKKVNVLRFDILSKSKKRPNLIVKTDRLFENNFNKKPDKVDILEESHFSNFENVTKGFNVFYFPSIGLYERYKKIVSKNSIEESSFELIAERKIAPTFFVVRKHNSYYKLFKIEHGDDDSIYIKFSDKYKAGACTRNIVKAGKVELLPLNKKINSPYVSYHRSGRVHLNDKNGDIFIEDLKTTKLEDIVENNSMVHIGSIVPKVDSLNFLPNIGKPPLEKIEFNCCVVGDSFSLKKLKSGLLADNFVIVDTNFLSARNSLVFELWIHANTEGSSIYSSLSGKQREGVFNCIAFNNKKSRIAWSIILRKIKSNVEQEIKEEFSLICTLGSKEEFLAYNLILSK